MRPVTSATILIVASVIVLCGCHSTGTLIPRDPTSAGTAAERAAIDALRKRLQESFSSGDLDGMASVYTKDAAFSAPGYPIVQGRDQIRQVFESKRPPDSTATFRPVETRILTPDWAYELGTVTVTARVGPDKRVVTADSTYLVILQKTPTGWHVYREALSPDGPAGASQRVR